MEEDNAKMEQMRETVVRPNTYMNNNYSVIV